VRSIAACLAAKIDSAVSVHMNSSTTPPKMTIAAAMEFARRRGSAVASGKIDSEAIFTDIA